MTDTQAVARAQATTSPTDTATGPAETDMRQSLAEYEVTVDTLAGSSKRVPPVGHVRLADTTDTPLGAVTTRTASSTTVRLLPSESEVELGSSETFDIVVTDSDGGVGAVTATVSIASNVAAIQSATVGGNAGVRNVSVADDGQSVRIRGALMNTDDRGSIVVGKVTIAGRSPGTTTVDLQVSSLGNESGVSYDIAATLGSSVTVSESTEAVELQLTSNVSTATVGEMIKFTVTRADSGARTPATITVGNRTVRTSDGVVRVDVTEGMLTDTDTLTATAGKPDEATTFLNDTVEITVGESSADSPLQTIVRPTSVTTTVGETATLGVVVESATGGVGAFSGTIEVSDNLQIVNVSVSGQPGIEDISVEDGQTRAVVSAALLDTRDTGSVEIVVVTVRGVRPGTSTVDLEISDLANESGTTYGVVSTDRTVAVDSPETVDTTTVTPTPTDSPTATATESPTVAPTDSPTATATESPTVAPTDSPTATVRATTSTGGGSDGSLPRFVLALLISVVAFVCCYVLLGLKES